MTVPFCEHSTKKSENRGMGEPCTNAFVNFSIDSEHSENIIHCVSVPGVKL